MTPENLKLIVTLIDSTFLELVKLGYNLTLHSRSVRFIIFSLGPGVTYCIHR